LKYFICLCLLQNLFCSDGFSQTVETEKIIRDIKKDYNALKYNEAEQEAKKALINYQQFSPVQLVEIHKYLGLIYYTQNRLDESEKQFKTALSINPDLLLSSLLVSPKIIEFFNNIKAEKEAKPDFRDELFTKYILVKDKRLGAGLRSSILPGWGQIYKGQKKKGTILISSWAVCLGSLLATHLLQERAHKAYLESKDTEKIESNYKIYNNYYKAKNSIALFSIALWLYAHIDAAVTEVSSIPYASLNRKQPIAFPTVYRNQFAITCQFQF